MQCFVCIRGIFEHVVLSYHSPCFPSHIGLRNAVLETRKAPEHESAQCKNLILLKWLIAASFKLFDVA